MSPQPPPPKTPFDMITSSTKLDMLKLFIPYMPPSTQSSFALFIKFQELQDTIKYFRAFPKGLNTNETSSKDNGTDNILSIIKPYLPAENQEMFDNIFNMMNMMEMMNAMNSMANESGEDNSMDFLKNMLSPEQQAMFESMNQMFDTPENEEGDLNNE